MIYEKISKACAEKGISIAALEKATGLGNGTVKGWIKTKPRVDLLVKVCDYLGLSLVEVTEGINEEKKEGE